MDDFPFDIIKGLTIDICEHAFTDVRAVLMTNYPDELCFIPECDIDNTIAALQLAKEWFQRHPSPKSNNRPIESNPPVKDGGDSLH